MRSITESLMLVLIIGVLLYDVFAMLYSGRTATVSAVTRDFCEANPIAVFAVGVVIGHIFFPLAK